MVKLGFGEVLGVRQEGSDSGQALNHFVELGSDGGLIEYIWWQERDAALLQKVSRAHAKRTVFPG